MSHDDYVAKYALTSPQGFSYATEGEGTINSFTGDFENSSFAGVNGRYPVIDPTAIATTDMAAMAAWEIMQGFYSALPQLDSKIESTTFNLFTESYGGVCAAILLTFSCLTKSTALRSCLFQLLL